MPLSPLQVQRAKILPADYISNYCMIQSYEGGPPIAFELWDFQRDALNEITRHARLIFLKARQLGLSWLTLAYMLWEVTVNEGRTALILNRGLEQSVELLDRVRFMLQRLPPELKVRVTKDSFNHLEFGDIGGRIFSLPGTEFAGSGVTANLVMVDEWAKIRGVDKILVSLLPTLAAGGKLVGISTAVGFHNPFAREWRKAISKDSRYYPIFIPWDAHPQRDHAWYEEKRREMPTERDLLQEYPGEWLDAFQLPGESVFRDEFDRKEHVVDAAIDPDAKWPRWRGIDFGYHHGIHLWAEVQAKRNVFVFAELHAERKTTKDMMRAVVEMDKTLGVDTGAAPAGCDPAGKAQTSVATESDHYTVQAAGIRVVFDQVAPKDRVTQIKQLLREGRLHIHKSCDFLIEALEQAQWAKAPVPTGSSAEPFPKETYEKDGLYEHPLDALGYMLITVFPVLGSPAAARTTRPRAPQPRRGKGGGLGGGYSKSEFG